MRLIAGLFLLFMASLFVGCKPLMMRLYGIKKPAVESEKSILKKATKYDMDTTNIASVDVAYFLEELDGQSLPDCAIYDSRGKYIEYRQSDTACNAGLFAFIPALDTANQYQYADKADLQTEWSKLRNLKGEALPALEQADFYILVYWSVWTGRLNKNHVKIWEDAARANKKCRIKFIKVNMDMQAYWAEGERKKIEEIVRSWKQ